MTLGLLDGPALAEALHTHPATIRQWAHRGHLTRHGTDPQGRALYNVTEALQYATVTPRCPGRSMPEDQQ